jgi:hypothetical protein
VVSGSLRLLLILLGLSALHAQNTADVRILYTPGKPVNTFDPLRALGAGIDGHERGEVLRMLSAENVKAMLAAGLKPLSYRLRTELAGEAWHWNPEGQWSDAAHKQGYWISNDRASQAILVSYGYRLPRRGNTGDQANNDGYSRLDDGDPATFWKSNPYLDERYTGEPNTAHPHWIVLDFGKSTPVNTLAVLWGTPAGAKFRVQYSDSANTEVNADGIWREPPKNEQTSNNAGLTNIHFADAPLTVRYLRLLITGTSHAAAPESTDIRDSLGVAIREVYAGVTDEQGAFHDVVHHAQDNTQTVMHVSSTDPWHRASDLDPRIEQPGFDLLRQRNLTQGVPMLAAFPVLYDVPENAAAELRYLRAHKFTVEQAELGEEPEEQHGMPEDYAALYLQWSKALHEVDPKLRIGGPSLVLLDPAVEPEPTWVRRLIPYFTARGRLGEFSFFSFEWYPFDEVCDPVAPQLAQATGILDSAIKRLREDGITLDIPLVMTEYGYSAFGSEAEVDLPGALLNADTVGLFLTRGGAQTYLYGYEPNELLQEKSCTWGNNMILLAGESGRAEFRMPIFYGAQLIAQQWADPKGGAHEVFPAQSGAENVTAYALRRPDGAWALMMINKDPKKTWRIRPLIGETAFGAADLYQYSKAQYRWKQKRDEGHPVKDLPPVHRAVSSSDPVELPPYSLTVLRAAPVKN